MHKLAPSLCFLGALTLTFPPLGAAHGRDWSQGQDLLEQHLQPGQTPTAYRRMLKELGYRITSVNSDTPNYVEYEVAKGDRSYEVQINLDEGTGRATNIDIARNTGTTNRTEAALDDSESDQAEQAASLNNPDYVLVITPVYVSAHQDRTEMGRMVEELENLPVGKDKQFYRRALERQGYKITDSASKGDRTQFSVEKDGRRALVNIRFDRETGESTQLSAFPLLINVAQGDGAQGNAAQSSTPRMEESSQARGAGRMVQDLESLPVGYGRRFYRNALQERGYEIIDETTSANETRFEIEKGGRRMALNVTFDDQGRGMDVVADRLGQGSSAQTSGTQRSRQSEQFAGNQ